MMDEMILTIIKTIPMTITITIITITNQGAVWTVDEIEFHRRRPQRSTDHR